MVQYISQQYFSNDFSGAPLCLLPCLVIQYLNHIYHVYFFCLAVIFKLYTYVCMLHICTHGHKHNVAGLRFYSVPVGATTYNLCFDCSASLM